MGTEHRPTVAGCQAERIRVGVIGATGAVGQAVLEVLGERSFPASEVVPFASERSAGRRLASAAPRSSAARSTTSRSRASTS